MHIKKELDDKICPKFDSINNSNSRLLLYHINSSVMFTCNILQLPIIFL